MALVNFRCFECENVPLIETVYYLQLYDKTMVLISRAGQAFSLKLKTCEKKKDEVWHWLTFVASINQQS